MYGSNKQTNTTKAKRASAHTVTKRSRRERGPKPKRKTKKLIGQTFASSHTEGVRRDTQYRSEWHHIFRRQGDLNPSRLEQHTASQPTRLLFHKSLMSGVLYTWFYSKNKQTFLCILILTKMIKAGCALLPNNLLDKRTFGGWVGAKEEQLGTNQLSPTILVVFLVSFPSTK